MKVRAWSQDVRRTRLAAYADGLFQTEWQLCSSETRRATNGWKHRLGYHFQVVHQVIHASCATQDVSGRLNLKVSTRRFYGFFVA